MHISILYIIYIYDIRSHIFMISHAFPFSKASKEAGASKSTWANGAEQCNRHRSTICLPHEPTPPNQEKQKGWHSERNASLASSLFLWPRKKFRLKEKLLT